MDSHAHHNEHAAISGSTPSWSVSSTPPSESPSQPPSPSRRSSSPRPPSLLSTRENDQQFITYMVQNNKIIAEMQEKLTGVKINNMDCIGVAEREDLARQVLILQAVDSSSHDKLRKIVFELQSDRIIRKWRNTKYAGLKIDWKKVIPELVVGNKFVRNWLTKMLLRKKADGTSEISDDGEFYSAWGVGQDTSRKWGAIGSLA
ncbi:75f57d54-f733-4dbf-8f52-2ec60e07d494 [Sclerotinia trifoliorum]|uniref:75f57d54-f733-4dbf-8f52-2ec60e07d494 n=1 Tax=Sclerotinia trifoliorum TaxID=28548 RepID=A0A8H2W3S6_9HELO|nr:75f57d54-f733-4dbf-8f52-2ec60e07d494 [Sclerotinia trifoliorum]